MENLYSRDWEIDYNSISIDKKNMVYVNMEEI